MRKLLLAVAVGTAVLAMPFVVSTPASAHHRSASTAQLYGTVVTVEGSAQFVAAVPLNQFAWSRHATGVRRVTITTNSSTVITVASTRASLAAIHQREHFVATFPPPAAHTLLALVANPAASVRLGGLPRHR